MSETAEVVIIGGGCMGVATAFHLASMGCTDVVLLEGDQLGSGSTSKSAGGVRMQFAEETNLRIALQGYPQIEHFEELTGEPIDFRQFGYLFLLTTPEELVIFDEAVALQHRYGIPTEKLTAAEAKRMLPQLHTDDVLAATFCPRDGYMTPEALVHGYAAAARRMGARLRTGRLATGITRDATGIVAVETTDGPIATRTVVCAAGAESATVGKWVDVELPVEPMPRWMHFTKDDCGIPFESPLTIDFKSSFYFHRETTGLVFGGPEQTLEEMSGPATYRLPALAEAGIASSWWGNYEVSPDHNAMLGGSAEVPGFYYATGFSGHGFQQSPAVGEHLAELIVGRTPTLDLSELSASRFAAGVRRDEHFII